MCWLRTALLTPSLVWALAAKAAEPLVFLVDTSAGMPDAYIQGNRAVAGVHADLAQALGRRLGREAWVRAVPRRRIAQELQAGVQADLVCDYHAAWLPGPFLWTQAFIPNRLVVITPRQNPHPPARLTDLAGRRVGTVAGYRYPEVEAALGSAFLREDAPSAEANLRKLEVGRMAHALTGLRVLEYQQRLWQFRLPLHPPLNAIDVRGQCGLSPRSRLSLEALEAAINQLVSEGELDRLLDRYR